jgi:CDP-diacylglycerol---glycerol-3-phosphate 3-phosphatidyltransferase
MNLPFYLTFMRIVMSPVFMALYLYGEAWGVSGPAMPYLLLAVMVICELSDILDGFLARRHNKVTELGKVLDPMADSIFRLTVFFSFTQGVVHLPLLLVLVFFLRDAIVNSLRTLCALQGVALAARLSGKVKAIVQATTTFIILLLMIPFTMGILTFASFYAICFYTTLAAAIYTFASGGEYIVANWKLIRKAFHKPSDRHQPSGSS